MKWILASIAIGVQVGFDVFLYIVVKELAKTMYEMSKILAKLSLRKEE